MIGGVFHLLSFIYYRMMKDMKKNIFFILFLAFCLLSGCAGKNSETITRSTFLLDTVVSFTIYNSEDEALADALVEQCAAYEKIFDRTDPESEVYALNHAGGKPVTVSDDLLNVLQCALEYAEATDGLFDVTICPASDLWDFTATSPSLPDDAALQTALAQIGWRNIVIDGNQVQLKNRAMIDLGGIAKGYIADCMAQTLRKNDIQSALINLGGNTITVGGRPDGDPFRIGIQKPFAEQNAMVGTMAVKDLSAVSSGVYQRSFTLNGVLYHHILDPTTGSPANTGLLSVTVITEESMRADALSTCIFLLGPEKGLAFAEQMGVQAALIAEDGTMTFTQYFTTTLDYQPIEN